MMVSLKMEFSMENRVSLMKMAIIILEISKMGKRLDLELTSSLMEISTRVTISMITFMETESILNLMELHLRGLGRTIICMDSSSASLVERSSLRHGRKVSWRAVRES